MTTKNSGDNSDEDAQGSFSDKDSRFGNFAANADDIALLSNTMLTRLSRTIESEIVPRLMMAFDASQSFADAADIGERWVDIHAPDLDVDEFVHLLLTQDAPVACEYVKALRADGIPLTTIYLDLLGPAARRLGEKWEHDECSFTDVTFGVCRMHQVLLDFSRCFEPRETTGGSGKRALIVPAPGEHHTFGLFLVVEFLRRAGWHCWTGTMRPPPCSSCCSWPWVHRLALLDRHSRDNARFTQAGAGPALRRDWPIRQRRAQPGPIERENSQHS